MPDFHDNRLQYARHPTRDKDGLYGTTPVCFMFQVSPSKNEAAVNTFLYRRRRTDDECVIVYNSDGDECGDDAISQLDPSLWYVHESVSRRLR